MANAPAALQAAGCRLQPGRLPCLGGVCPPLACSSNTRNTQVPDEEKRRRADYVIDTGCSLPDTEAAVGALVDSLLARGSGGAFARALAAAEGGGH